MADKMLLGAQSGGLTVCLCGMYNQIRTLLLVLCKQAHQTLTLNIDPTVRFAIQMPEVQMQQGNASAAAQPLHMPL